MPDWVADELRAAAKLEPDLLPDDDSVSKFQFYAIPQNPLPGEMYSRARDVLSRQTYDYILVIPWLKPGGADRGILFHLRAIREVSPDASLLVISTEPSESEWKARLPEEADFLELGLLMRGLELPEQVAVLTRLLIQLRPRVTHIVNSKVAWMAVESHGLSLRQSGRLFASLFCDDFNASMKPVGYAREFLRNTYRHFDWIFCDNTTYPKIWSRDLGVPRDIFQVLPFPYDGEVSRSRDQNRESDRVLWAGRLDRQKRLDVLLDIAKAMPLVQFDVYGAPVMGESMGDLISKLSALPNVVMHGRFERLEDAVSPRHFAFLMTTGWEGTPTILLDVAAAGLPIVAPDVGGIPDIVNVERLVSDPNDVASFVDKLAAFKSDPQLGRTVSAEQFARLERDRSWSRFVKRLDDDGNYFTDRPDSV